MEFYISDTYSNNICLRPISPLIGASRSKRLFLCGPIDDCLTHKPPNAKIMRYGRKFLCPTPYLKCERNRITINIKSVDIEYPSLKPHLNDG